MTRLRVVLLVTVMMLIAGQPASAAGEKLPEGYLVVPFVNRSGQKGLDWMASALATSVAERLELHPGLRPGYGAAILDGLPLELDEAGTAARATDRGVRWVFGGWFARPHWKTEVGLQLYETTSDTTLKLVAEASQSGERDQLWELLQRALADVLAKQGMSPAEDVKQAMARVPTKDLYALTLYGRALNAQYGLGGAGNLAIAEQLFRRVLFIDPKFAEARHAFAVLLQSKGERTKAAAQLSYALDLRANYWGAIVMSARLYRSENRRQATVDLVERALALRPYDSEMRFLRGTMAWEAGELDSALTDLVKVTEAQPQHLGARRLLVQVYAAKGDLISLTAELDRVTKLAPEDPELRIELVAALIRLGRYEPAIAALEEVLKRRPRHVQALKMCGDLYRKLGDSERAIVFYEKLRRINPEDPRPYFLVAAVYSEAGNEARAEQVLQEAINQFRKYQGEAWLNLGAIALKRGDYTRAQALLERAINRAPNHPKAHYNYALALNALNQRDRALAELKSAGEMDPEDPSIPYLAGVIYLRLGRLEDARSEFAEALKRRPDHVDAQYNMNLLEDIEKRYKSERSGTGAR